jgi:hypothetical protein
MDGEYLLYFSAYYELWDPFYTVAQRMVHTVNQPQIVILNE